MTASPVFVTCTIPLSATTSVKGVLMPDGNVVAAQAIVDPSNTMLDPVKDSTVQAAIAAIAAATAALQQTG